MAGNNENSTTRRQHLAVPFINNAVFLPQYMGAAALPVPAHVPVAAPAPAPAPMPVGPAHQSG